MSAGAIVVIVVAATGLLMMRFRKRWLARINIVFTNRITSLFAGWLPGFGIVTHVGRKSGKVYRTPLNVFRVPTAFIIALTYSSQSEWVKNVLAAGGCKLKTRAIIRADATFRMPPDFGAAEGRDEMFRLWIEGGFGSERFGRVRCVVTHANLQPAVACYQCRPGDSTWRALALEVLRIEDGLITEIVAFPPDSFPAFRLPMMMDAPPEMNKCH